MNGSFTLLEREAILPAENCDFKAGKFAWVARSKVGRGTTSPPDPMIYSLRYQARRRMNRIPKSWIAIIAIVAMVGVLFVLITPAPDELPSTGPHSLHKVFALISSYFNPLAHEIFSGSQFKFVAATPLSRDNLLAVTCARLC